MADQSDTLRRRFPCHWNYALLGRWAEVLFSVDLWMFKPQLDVAHCCTPMNLLALTCHLRCSDTLLHFLWWHCSCPLICRGQSQLRGRDRSRMFGMAPVLTVRAGRNLRAPRPAGKIGKKVAEAFIQHSSERAWGPTALWRDMGLGLLSTCSFMLLPGKGPN